jgi:hypothetical protein
MRDCPVRTNRKAGDLAERVAAFGQLVASDEIRLQVRKEESRKSSRRTRYFEIVSSCAFKGAKRLTFRGLRDR